MLKNPHKSVVSDFERLKKKLLANIQAYLREIILIIKTIFSTPTLQMGYIKN